MAKRSTILAGTLCMLLSMSGALHADIIHLNDGSSINGEILSLKKGVYTIRSSTMGILKLRKTQVKAINNGEQQFIANQYSPNYFNHINKSVSASPDIQQSISGLNTDPIVQQILADPELMSAIQHRDMEKLQQNPLILKLMKNPQMQAITQQLK